MRVSDEGRKAIQQFEGCRLEAYQDVVGVWTIAYGHTGPDVHAGLTITPARADALLALDLQRFERAVSAAVTRTLHQCEFDALVSLAFNIGAAAFAKSTLVRLLNEGRWTDAAAQFTVWHKAGGALHAGLLRRRTRELMMFVGVA